MTPILVVDNTGRQVCRGEIYRDGPARSRAYLRFGELAVLEDTAPRLHEVLAGPTPDAARIEVEHIKREVAVRIERRSRRRRWLRVAYGSGRALGALAVLAALTLLGAGVVYGAGRIAWWLFL